MNTDIMEKINAVLSDEAFYAETNSMTNPDEIVAVVKSRVPEASEAEIDQVLITLSKALKSSENELNESELENVAGGFAITLTLATLATAAKCVAGAAAVGAFGGGIAWYWKHRNC